MNVLRLTFVINYILCWTSIITHTCITSYIGYQYVNTHALRLILVISNLDMAVSISVQVLLSAHVFWQACGVARLAALHSICREAAITAEHVALVEHAIRSSHGLCDFGRFGPGLVACYQREGPNHARAS